MESKTLELAIKNLQQQKPDEPVDLKQFLKTNPNQNPQSKALRQLINLNTQQTKTPNQKTTASDDGWYEWFDTINVWTSDKVLIKYHQQIQKQINAVQPNYQIIQQSSGVILDLKHQTNLTNSLFDGDTALDIHVAIEALTNAQLINKLKPLLAVLKSAQ